MVQVRSQHVYLRQVGSQTLQRVVYRRQVGFQPRCCVVGCCRCWARARALARAPAGLASSRPSRGGPYWFVVVGGTCRRRRPCIVGLVVGDVSTLWPLSLLGDLHTGGETLVPCSSRSALARSTRGLNPVTEWRWTFSGYKVLLMLVSPAWGSGPVARPWRLCSLGRGSPRDAYRPHRYSFSRSVTRLFASSIF